MNASNGEVMEASYKRISDRLAEFKWTIRNNFYGPLLKGLAGYQQATHLSNYDYGAYYELSPQLPEAGPEYADYFSALDYATLPAASVAHRDPQPVVVLDGKGYVEPRDIYTRMTFNVDRSTPDRQVLISVAKRMDEFYLDYYKQWHEDADLAIEPFDFDRVERQVQERREQRGS